jgi:hypothetical protein
MFVHLRLHANINRSQTHNLGRAAYALGLLLGVAARCVGRATALASVSGVSLPDRLADDKDAADELGLAVAVQAVVQAPDSHARNAGLSLLPQLAALFPLEILEQIGPIFEHICDVEAAAWPDSELVAVLRQVTKTISVVASASAQIARYVSMCIYVSLSTYICIYVYMHICNTSTPRIHATYLCFPTAPLLRTSLTISN